MVGIDMEMPSCCVTYTSENDNYTACPFYKICEQRETIKTNYKPSDCPLVEIEERKVGKWIKYNTTEKIDMFGDRVKVSSYKCSECGRIISDISEDGFTNKLQDYPYCHCGAKMRGVENE